MTTPIWPPLGGAVGGREHDGINAGDNDDCQFVLNTMRRPARAF
jgi:hypothetical protein